jgi:hypothetical protein
LTEAPPQEELEEIQWIDPASPGPGPADSREATDPEPESRPEVDFSPEVAAEFEPEPAPVHRPSPKRAQNAQARPATAEPAESRPRPTRRPTAPTEVEPGRIAVLSRRKHGGRVVLTVAAVTILAVGVYFYKSWRNRLAELPHIAEVNAAEGKAALESGQFDEAKQKLGRAAAAYKELKANDSAATEAIQLAKEAAILADQCLQTPAEIIEDIARREDADGLRRFDDEYKGRAVIVDGKVAKIGDPVVLTIRLFVGRGPTPAKEGSFDLTGFELLKGMELKEGDQLIFGGRYESMRIEDNKWRITLQPGSGSWMTNAKALAIVLREAPPS